MKKLMLLLWISMLIAGCGKKESTPTPTGPTVPADAPRFKTHSIIVPAKLAASSDAHAQMVAYYMGLANALSASLPNYFLPPNLRKAVGSEGDGPWEYSWVEGEATITVKIKAVGDKYLWEVYYSGKRNDQAVTNWLGVRAEQAKNERSGSFTSFVPPGTTIAASFVWSLGAANELIFQVEAPSFMAGSRFTGQINTDHSGTLKIEQLVNGVFVLVQSFSWNADGSGSWIEYNGNVITAQGSWN